MFLRRTYLESRFSLPNAGERTTDIAMREPITNIWIEFRCANGTTSNVANLLADCVDAIEVIDGSDVIYALDGKEALALTAYYCDDVPNQLITELPNNTQNLSIVIPFGRFEGDPMYAFEPGRFLNPQVRVKWNLANVRAVGVTGFLTGGLVYTVVATCMEGGESAKGYLMTKEIYSYVSAVGVEYVDLPTDYPYKALLVRHEQAGKHIFQGISNIMLHVNQQQYVLFNMRMTDFIRYNSAIEPLLHMTQQFFVASAAVVPFVFKYDEHPAFTCINVPDTVYNYQYLALGQGILTETTGGAPQGAAIETDAQVSGYCPFGAVIHNFGRRDEPGDYFDAPAFRSCRLELTGGVAGSDCYVALVQARPY